MSRKSEVRSLFPINWFNSCIDSLFAGMTLTLHKSQVDHSGFMQWWICSSLISALFSAEASFETASVLFYRCSVLRNNNMAINPPRFTSNNGRRRFTACDCWTQTSWQVMQRESRQWLLIAELNVILYCVKKSIDESEAVLPQVWKISC